MEEVALTLNIVIHRCRVFTRVISSLVGAMTTPQSNTSPGFSAPYKGSFGVEPWNFICIAMALSSRYERLGGIRRRQGSIHIFMVFLHKTKMDTGGIHTGDTDGEKVASTMFSGVHLCDL